MKTIDLARIERIREDLKIAIKNEWGDFDTDDAVFLLDVFDTLSTDYSEHLNKDYVANADLVKENAKLKEALRVFKKLSDEIQADAERQQVFDLLGQELWMEI